MYRKILIATDGSELAGRAVAHGVGLAKSLGASVTIVTVTENWSAVDMASAVEFGAANPIGDYEKAEAEIAARILTAAEAKAREAGVNARTVHVRDRHPADGIVETANSEGCDLIVMASHGRRGVERVLIGSQATKVLTYTKIPTLIVR